MKDFKDKLVKTAIEKGICAQGYERLMRDDREALIDYYLEMPDWCMERDFPDLQTLTDEFADCEDKGVFVNKSFKGELLNDLQTYVFHNCTGTIKVGLNMSKEVIPILHLANGCRLRIVGVGDVKPKVRTIVPIYVYGHNDLSARDNCYVKFEIYKQNLL